MTKYQLMVVAANVPDTANVTALWDCVETRTAEVQMDFGGMYVLRRYSYDSPAPPHPEVREEL
jgi:hypothetical protein